MNKLLGAGVLLVASLLLCEAGDLPKFIANLLGPTNKNREFDTLEKYLSTEAKGLGFEENAEAVRKFSETYAFTRKDSRLKNLTDTINDLSRVDYCDAANIVRLSKAMELTRTLYNNSMRST